jgi:magnesium transporter
MIEARVYRAGRPEEGSTDLEHAAATLRADGTFVWLDAVDPTADDLDAVAAAIGLHPVTVEDALHRQQRPRVELFEGYAFVALRPFVRDGDGDDRIGEVHAFVGPRFFGTFRFGPHPFPVERARERWERQPEVLAEHGGGFAAWALIDEVVDGYLTLVEEIEDRADLLEDDVFGEGRGEAGATDVQERIFRLKRLVVQLRRVVSPLRQGLDLLQEEPGVVSPPLQPYYRDVMEHALRVAELADSIRDLLTSLLEVRLSQLANHTNDIMKKQAAWAGIILVPTLIAGIYGMNFRHMPELGWAVGYPIALGSMIAAAIALYLVFKRKEWL